MVTLIDGNNYTITGLINATCDTTGSTGNYAYDDDSLTATAYLKYYYKGALLYTSTAVNSGTYKAFTTSYNIDQSSDFANNGSIYTWTISNASDWVSFNDSKVGFTTNASTSVWGDTPQIYFATDNTINIKEASGVVHSSTAVPEEGAEIQIAYTGASPSPAGGSRLAPPPIVVHI